MERRLRHQVEEAVKVSRRKRRITTRWPKRCLDAIQARKAELEAEVEWGLRDARTLVAVRGDVARGATVAFPRHPFGEPAPW